MSNIEALAKLHKLMDMVRATGWKEETEALEIAIRLLSQKIDHEAKGNRRPDQPLIWFPQ